METHSGYTVSRRRDSKRRVASYWQRESICPVYLPLMRLSLFVITGAFCGVGG